VSARGNGSLEFWRYEGPLTVKALPMKIDILALLRLLAVPALIAAYLAWAIWQGRIRMKSYVDYRDFEPGLFWMVVSVYASLGVLWIVAVFPALRNCFSS